MIGLVCLGVLVVLVCVCTWFVCLYVVCTCLYVFYCFTVLLSHCLTLFVRELYVLYVSL